jgi:hypothetical protein
MEFFAGGAEGGFLPKKEPSAIFSEEIGHFFWQLLYAFAGLIPKIPLFRIIAPAKTGVR